LRRKILNFDDIVKRENSLPLEGGGLGRGWQKCVFSTAYPTLPLISSRQGRGKITFYDFINFEL
jgi:hypothetical protein